MPQLTFASGNKWAVIFILDNNRFRVTDLAGRGSVSLTVAKP